MSNASDLDLNKNAQFAVLQKDVENLSKSMAERFDHLETKIDNLVKSQEKVEKVTTKETYRQEFWGGIRKAFGSQWVKIGGLIVTVFLFSHEFLKYAEIQREKPSSAQEQQLSRQKQEIANLQSQIKQLSGEVK